MATNVMQMQKTGKTPTGHKHKYTQKIKRNIMTKTLHEDMP